MVKIAVCFLHESQQPKPVPAHRPRFAISFGNIFRFRVSKACGLRKKLVTLIDTSEKRASSSLASPLKNPAYSFSEFCLFNTNRRATHRWMARNSRRDRLGKGRGRFGKPDEALASYQKAFTLAESTHPANFENVIRQTSSVRDPFVSY